MPLYDEGPAYPMSLVRYGDVVDLAVGSTVFTPGPAHPGWLRSVATSSTNRRMSERLRLL